jgi:hypothetical protein
MQKQYYWFLMALCLIWPLIVSAQPRKSYSLDEQREEVYSYIYRITVENDHNQTSVLTGFKPKGYAGILTALHGLTLPGKLTFMIVRYAKGSGRTLDPTFPTKKGKVEIAYVDFDHDIAYLTCSDLVTDGGLDLAQNPVGKEQKKLRVFGFPDRNSLESKEPDVYSPPVMKLDEIVNDKAIKKLTDRSSPKPDVSVIQLEPGGIKPGDSGAPVMNEFNQVVGVANGGAFTDLGSPSIAWAQLINGLPRIQVKDAKGQPIREVNRRFQELTKLTVQLLMSNQQIRTDKKLYGDNETPRLTIGGTFSRPFWFNNEGIKLGAYNQLNAAFDAYLETRLKEKWLGGIYISSRYLQYQVTQTSAHNLPPPNGDRQQHQGPAFDLYGLQLSHIWHRGTVHNAYIGAGGLYVPDRVFNDYKDARLLNNARIFTGYRLYLGPKRNLGLELRAAWIHQNTKQVVINRRLGIADIIPDQLIPLNQWYLCGGLTYSFYRHQ